jgi:hypothetical protein
VSPEELISRIPPDEFVTGDDGCVVYWPSYKYGGALSAWELRVIADYLDARNAAWHAVVMSDPAINPPKRTV